MQGKQAELKGEIKGLRDENETLRSAAKRDAAAAAAQELTLQGGTANTQDALYRLPNKSKNGSAARGVDASPYVFIPVRLIMGFAHSTMQAHIYVPGFYTMIGRACHFGLMRSFSQGLSQGLPEIPPLESFLKA